jgi:hypothetical protein
VCLLEVLFGGVCPEFDEVALGLQALTIDEHINEE